MNEALNDSSGLEFIPASDPNKRDLTMLNGDDATSLLIEAADCIGNRAAERDQPSGERSMARCVAAFNEITGHKLTEVQGWQFMALLKMSRAQAGALRRDDFVDGAAYFALAGETAIRAEGA